MGTKYSIKNMKPKGWWLDINHCIEACKEVKTLKRLQEEYGGCFSAIRRYGFAEECYKYLVVEDSSHRGKPRKNKKPAGWWNSLEHCIEACKECKNLTELHRRYGGCNISIREHGWQDECYKHFDYVRVRQYSREQLEVIAKKYTTYQEFRTHDHGAYASAKSHGILENICVHMPPLQKSKEYDDKPDLESVKEHAQRYTSRSEFQREDPRYYRWAQKHGVLDEVCQHMLRRGNKKKRCIYAAEFPDNHAYIGLTYFAERRWADHLRSEDSAFCKHVKETGLEPVWKRLTEYIDYIEASEQEGLFKEKYQKEGWAVLNIAKTGSLGGETGYSKEQVLREAAKYESLKEFRESASGYYQSAYRSDYWDEVRAICKPLYRGGYSEKELREIISRFDNSADLRKYRHAVIDAAMRMGIWKDATKHFVERVKAPYHRVSKYTEAQIEEIAKKYMHKSDFAHRNGGAYEAAKKMGIFERVCAHMIPKPTVRKWTKDAVRAEAKKYKYYTAFAKSAPGAVGAASRYGILKDVCAHMISGRYKYTLEEAKEVAKTYRNRTELFNKDKGAFNLLKDAGLLDELLPIQPAYNLKWTDEARREAAAQCKTRKEFKERFPQAMDVTRVKKDWETIAPHLAKDRLLWTEEEIAKRASHCHNMKELKEYDYACWYHCTKHKGKTAIAKKYFKK